MEKIIEEYIAESNLSWAKREIESFYGFRKNWLLRYSGRDVDGQLITEVMAYIHFLRTRYMIQTSNP